MKRLSSQLVFCDANSLLRSTVVEQNDDNVITDIIDLSTRQSETAHTVFYDGVISGEIISLKQYLSNDQLLEITKGIVCLDLSEINKTPFVFDKSSGFIVDFGTNNFSEINKMLKENFDALSAITVFELINACSYLPQRLLGLSKNIEVSHQTDLVLWQGVNLVSHALTPQTSVRLL